MPTPARLGYRLKDFAEKDRGDFDDYYGVRGCSCFINAPCGYCTHPGNPLNQIEDDECWEIDTEEEMSRTEIVNKTKSQWFGYKYRVTPELNKALQKAVFAADGEGWGTPNPQFLYTDAKFLWVDDVGNLSYSNYEPNFDGSANPEKKIKLVNGVLVGDNGDRDNSGSNENKGSTISPKGVKIDNSTGAPEGYTWTEDAIEFFETAKMSPNWANWGGGWTIDLAVDKKWLIKKDSCITEKDDVKSDRDPLKLEKEAAEWLYGKRVEGGKRDEDLDVMSFKLDWSKLEKITPTDLGCALIVNNKEENTMTNKTNRRAVIVRVWDNDVSLPVEDALVLTSDEILTEDSDQAVIQEFLAQGDIKGAIMEHNKVRENTVNVEILNRVGNKVMLQPIRKISELTIEVVKV